MPAKSKVQQKAAGAALAAKRGEQPKSRLRGASREMAASMSEEQLSELASTRRKGKPTRVGVKKTAAKPAPAKRLKRKTTSRKSVR